MAGYGDVPQEERSAEDEPGAELAVKSPLLRALLHVKWATLLQKAGKHERFLTEAKRERSAEARSF